MKTGKGFTIIEVLITLGIFSSFLVLILRQHVFSVGRLLWGQQHVERVLYVKQQLLHLFLAPPEKQPRKKKLESIVPSMEIESIIKTVSRKSSLKEFRDDIMVVSSVGKWEERGKLYEIPLMSFVIKPEKKKKK